ncbi:MAG: hypothetical protein QNJ73_05585 [Gammaproteobacteria bacterium]|nr:hypothetical protein [Gammaproteobacteria bacterium]
MSLLDEILALTDAVERCIDSGDWLGASDVNARRQQLLVELCGDGNERRLDSATRAALSQILQRNQATESRLRGERNRIAGSASKLKRGRQALDAYRLNTGGAAQEA